MNAYADALMRYFSFSGRSSRSQFWLFQLVALLMVIIAIEIDILRGDQLRVGHYGLVTTCVIVFQFIPQWTVSIRRLHDIGRSGWWYLLLFVPFAGFVLLYWQCKASDPGSNDYGDDPHDAPPPEPASTVPSRSIGLTTAAAPRQFATPRPAPAGGSARAFGMRGQPGR